LDSSRKAINYLHEALKLDPEFSQGWVTLATFLAADYNLFDVEPHDQARAMIYSALDHARRLDQNLLAIHLVLGRVLYEVDWSWQAADAELNQAIELEPENSEAHRLEDTWRRRTVDLTKQSSIQRRPLNSILSSHGIISRGVMRPTAPGGSRRRKPTFELRWT